MAEVIYLKTYNCISKHLYMIIYTMFQYSYVIYRIGILQTYVCQHQISSNLLQRFIRYLLRKR